MWSNSCFLILRSFSLLEIGKNRTKTSPQNVPSHMNKCHLAETPLQQSKLLWFAIAEERVSLFFSENAYPDT